MSSDLKFFKRDKGEASTSRLIQFNVPSIGFKPNKSQTDYSKVALKFINDNLDEAKTYHPPESFELTQSELCGHLYSKVEQDIQQDLQNKPSGSCSGSTGMNLSQQQKESLFDKLLNLLKSGQQPDPCNFFTNRNMLFEFIQMATNKLRNHQISLTDYDLIINYLNKIKNENLSCLGV